MTEPSFLRFLARSLALLADELPRASRAVAEQLGPRTVAFRIAGEHFYLTARSAKLRIVFECETPDLEFGASRETMLALTDGELSLIDAVLANDVQLRGPLTDLLAFHDALVTFARGAMRCPGILELREECLQGESYG